MDLDHRSSVLLSNRCDSAATSYDGDRRRQVRILLTFFLFSATAVSNKILRDPTMRPPIEELLRRYPLRLMPIQGALRMLIWYTHSDGHHAIFARDDVSASKLFLHALKRFGAEPKEYLSIRVVAPPHAYLERYATINYNNDVGTNVDWVMGVVEEELLGELEMDDDFAQRRRNRDAAFRKFPEFRACSYGPSDRLADTTDEEREEDRVSHYGCTLGCVDGFFPAEGDWSDFYERIGRKAWETMANLSDSRHMVPLRSPLSDLPEHDPRQPLRVAMNSFGHHQHGFAHKTVVPHEAFFQGVLFFYQGEQLEMPDLVVREVEEKKRLAEKDKQKQQERYEENVTKRRKDRSKEFALLFPNQKERL